MKKTKEQITLAHGNGGRKMHELVSAFMKEFDSPILSQRKDSAIIGTRKGEIAFTTDSYVVDPIFFPGGDIGSLAVYGTVNDLAVCGARPLFISLGLVIEEGFPAAELKRIVKSAAAAAKKAGVKIVTGDTKVVERGACDKIFINTSGIGRVYRGGLDVKNIRAGDAVIISGSVGDHAVSILSKREGIGFRAALKSDSAPLGGLTEKALAVSRKVRFMRDPTRGGVGTTLNEMVQGGKFGIEIDEDSIPVRGAVRSACELLGLEPLYLACEGRVIIVVAGEDAPKIISAMRRHRDGRMARVIGRVSGDHPGRVYMKASSGGRRIVDMLSGEQLPRIC